MTTLAMTTLAMMVRGMVVRGVTLRMALGMTTLRMMVLGMTTLRMVVRGATIPGTMTQRVTTSAVTMARTAAGAADASDRCARQPVRARRRLATSRAPLLRRWPVPGRVISTQGNLRVAQRESESVK